MKKTRIGILIGGAAIALGALACGSGGTVTKPSATPTASQTITTPTAAPTTAKTSSTPTDDNTTAAVSLEQQNAAKSAQTYLNMEGFSRAGLIDQLTSSYGDGYTKKAATAAVDSLHINWNEQAVRSAQNFLETQSFSRAGLISQLEFDGYTKAQATYGVSKAGL